MNTNEMGCNNETLDLIRQVASAKSEANVRQLSQLIVEKIGGDHFIYLMVRENRYISQCDLFCHFANCSPGWPALYEERKWFMLDPCVEYGRLNTEPAVFSSLPRKTQGQMHMMAAAAKYGFRSGLVIPTHSCLGAHEWLGILTVGSSASPDIGEEILLSNRITFRAFAMELMDWWKGNLKKEAIDRFNIGEQEFCILQHLERGRSVLEIAASMDMNKSSIYRYLDSLKDKLNANKTQDTVKQAKLFGLLS